MLSMMNTSGQFGFSLVLGVGRIDNNNYMDIHTPMTYQRFVYDEGIVGLAKTERVLTFR